VIDLTLDSDDSDDETTTSTVDKTFSTDRFVCENLLIKLYCLYAI